VVELLVLLVPLAPVVVVLPVVLTLACTTTGTSTVRWYQCSTAALESTGRTVEVVDLLCEACGHTVPSLPSLKSV
jgi:hypothetical protein